LEQWLIDIVEDIESSKDLLDIKLALGAIRERLGYRNILYGIKLPSGFTRSSTLIVSDYPPEWLDRYGEMGYVNRDPVAVHCFNSQRPFGWCRLTKAETQETRRFVSEAHDFGLVHGMSIGMPRFDGESGLISVVSDGVLTEDSRSFRYTALCLNALQPYIHEGVRKQVESAAGSQPLPSLTAREKECLLWTAEGKTAYEISVILSIAEATVVFHLKNAIRKLEVGNRYQAVAKAVLQGLIMPQFSGASVPTYYF
jgi:DNA-binding CsgD family transcriptional regulator